MFMPKFISDVVVTINENLDKNLRKRFILLAKYTFRIYVSKSIFPSNTFHLFLKDMYSNDLTVFLTVTICRAISICSLVLSKLKFTLEVSFFIGSP